MTTKAFFVLIAAVVLLGGSIGGAFAGGLALGKRRAADGAVVDDHPVARLVGVGLELGGVGLPAPR